MNGLTPNAAIRAFRPYRVPAPERRIDLDLRGNVGPPPSTAVRQALGQAMRLNQYPDASALERRLADRWGLRPEAALVTAGADDALDRLARAFGGPGRSVVLFEPGFSMTTRYWSMMGTRVIALPWPGTRFPLEAACEAFSEADAVVLTTPNNPTGATIPLDAVEAIRAANPVGLLAVDLAYTEFADRDLTPEVLRLPGTVAVRTFSKAWGLAGLRVGWVAGATSVVQWLRTVGQPFANTGPALAAAEVALKCDESRVQSFAATTRGVRRELEAALSTAGASVIPGQANFAFARVSDRDGLIDVLAEHGIAARTWPASSELGDAIRIGCPLDSLGLDKVVNAIRAYAKRRAS